MSTPLSLTTKSITGKDEWQVTLILHNVNHQQDSFIVSVAIRELFIEIKNSEVAHCIDIYNTKNHIDAATSPILKRKNKLW